MGTVEITVMAQRMVTGVVRVLDFRASVVVLAALALACVVASFIFSRYCKECRYFCPAQYRRVSNQLFQLLQIVVGFLLGRCVFAPVVPIMVKTALSSNGKSGIYCSNVALFMISYCDE